MKSLQFHIGSVDTGSGFKRKRSFHLSTDIDAIVVEIFVTSYW